MLLRRAPPSQLLLLSPLPLMLNCVILRNLLQEQMRGPSCAHRLAFLKPPPTRFFRLSFSRGPSESKGLHRECSTEYGVRSTACATTCTYSAPSYSRLSKTRPHFTESRLAGTQVPQLKRVMSLIVGPNGIPESFRQPKKLLKKKKRTLYY